MNLKIIAALVNLLSGTRNSESHFHFYFSFPFFSCLLLTVTSKHDVIAGLTYNKDRVRRGGMPFPIMYSERLLHLLMNILGLFMA